MEKNNPKLGIDKRKKTKEQKLETRKKTFQRTINKFNQVTEMGPVTYPAYPDTTAAMRSLENADKEDEKREEAEKAEFEKRFARLKQKYQYTKIK